MKLTKEEVDERYGDVELKLRSYYKYSFAFTGFAPDGARVIAFYGGNSDDIYRYSVKVTEVVKFKCCNNWNLVCIKDADDKELYCEHKGW